MQKTADKSNTANTINLTQAGRVGYINPMAKFWIMLNFFVLYVLYNLIQWGWWTPAWEVSDSIVWTGVTVGSAITLVILRYFMGDTKGNN